LNKCPTVGTLLNSVMHEFSQVHRSHVLQVVAVPLHREFPKYDFFLLHRTNEFWSVAAGYQCKPTSEYPTKAAEVKTRVGVSVWVEGRCKGNRAATDGAGKRRLVDNTTSKGWAQHQYKMTFLGSRWHKRYPRGQWIPPMHITAIYVLPRRPITK
jgi:hypothetical protein